MDGIGQQFDHPVRLFADLSDRYQFGHRLGGPKVRADLSERWTVGDDQVPGVLANLPEHLAHRDHLPDSRRGRGQRIESAGDRPHAGDFGHSQLDLQVLVESRRSMDGQRMKARADLLGLVVEAFSSKMQRQTEVVGHGDGQDTFAKMDGAKSQCRGNRRAAHTTLAGDDDQSAFEHRSRG